MYCEHFKNCIHALNLYARNIATLLLYFYRYTIIYTFPTPSDYLRIEEVTCTKQIIILYYCYLFYVTSIYFHFHDVVGRS